MAGTPASKAPEAEAGNGPPVTSTGPIGRLARAGLGLGLLFALLWPLSRLGTFHEPATLREPMLYLITAISLLLIPYILDIGLGWGRGQQTQWIALAAFAPLVALDLLFFDQLWSWPVAVYVLILQTWTFGTLALGYLLAAVLGTPGCELRAYAHLASRLKGGTLDPGFCPAGLDGLDAWEARTFDRSAQR